MSLRCQAHRLTARAAIERFQEWVYHTDHPIEALVTENYFGNVGGRILKGDVIEAYAVGVTCAQHLRLFVSRSDREQVVVAPFMPSHDVDGFRIDATSSAGPSSVQPKAADKSELELRHLRHGRYRIVNGVGEVVVGDIQGHRHGVDLYGRIREGRLSVENARREVEKTNLDAIERVEHDDKRRG